MSRMGSEPILCICVCITRDAMLNFDCGVDSNADDTCEQGSTPHNYVTELPVEWNTYEGQQYDEGFRLRISHAKVRKKFAVIRI